MFVTRPKQRKIEKSEWKMCQWYHFVLLTAKNWSILRADKICFCWPHTEIFFNRNGKNANRSRDSFPRTTQRVRHRTRSAKKRTRSRKSTRFRFHLFLYFVLSAAKIGKNVKNRSQNRLAAIQLKSRSEKTHTFCSLGGSDFVRSRKRNIPRRGGRVCGRGGGGGQKIARFDAFNVIFLKCGMVLNPFHTIFSSFWQKKREHKHISGTLSFAPKNRLESWETHKLLSLLSNVYIWG